MTQKARPVVACYDNRNRWTRSLYFCVSYNFHTKHLYTIFGWHANSLWLKSLIFIFYFYLHAIFIWHTPKNRRTKHIFIFRYTINIFKTLDIFAQSREIASYGVQISALVLPHTTKDCRIQGNVRRCAVNGMNVWSWSYKKKAPPFLKGRCPPILTGSIIIQPISQA